MKKKLLGTAIIAASTVAFTSGCGILETLDTVKIPDLGIDKNSYVVQPGDTLESVASRYKIDPDSLKSVNSLQLAELVPGQRIKLLRNKRGEEVVASRPTAVASNDRVAPIGGAEGVAVGQPVVIPNTTQTTAGAGADSNRIRTDVVVPPVAREEIIGVVDAATGDDLLDDQPIFVADGTVAPAPQAGSTAVVRPQGVETIVQSVNVDRQPVTSTRIPVPTAGSVEIVDANSAAPTKRVTVNTRARGWNWPVRGTITKDFALREINRQGLDIDPGANAAVQAAADGEVVYSGRDLASYGNLVILRHDDNFLSAYSKVSEIFVKENQVVKAGDLIAAVGKNDSGNHEMHFEIRQNGEPVNPVDYLPAL